MLNIKVSTNSNLEIRIPTRELPLRQLAKAYIAHELSLAPEERLPLPPLAEVQALAATLELALQAQQAAEADRSLASLTYREAMAATIRQLRRVRQYLVWRHATQLPLLEQWGFNVVTGKRGLRVKMPIRHEDWIWLLERYVAREAAQTPEEQLADPSLAEMQGLLATLQQSRSTRDAGESDRLHQTTTYITAAEDLRLALRMAAANLLLFTLNGRSPDDLRSWGFELVTAVTPAADAETPVDPETLPDPA